MRHSFRGQLTMALCLSGLLAGCASDQEKIDAIHALNQGFQVEYEKLLVEKGTRTYAASRAEAFVAMRVALAQLGMRTEQQDLAIGHLAVAANAPLPLTEDEWHAASQADLPLLRKIISPYVGVAANFVQFDPAGLEVVINATFLDSPKGSEISLTVRLREIAAARSGWPRREYVSPHVLTLGIDKIFTTFERELSAAQRR